MTNPIELAAYGWERADWLTDYYPDDLPEDWRKLAEKELRGRSVDDLTWNTLEGIPVKPLYTAEDHKARDEIERQAKEAEAARSKRQKEHIDRTLEEELLVVPDDVRDQLRTAYRTPSKERTEKQTALLEEHPSVGNISNGSLYLYAQQRARREAARVRHRRRINCRH